MTTGLPIGQPLRPEDEQTAAAPEASGTEAIIPSGQEGTGLSPEARQRLDERVAAAGGDAAAVAREVANQLTELDDRPMPEEGPERTEYQAARALLIAQVSYLEKLASSKAG
jgi:hypothetical protein